MSYNILKDARSIKNSLLCRFDSSHAYTTDFSVNGDVDGWDVYNNVYMYGCWSGVLFGSSYEFDCHIGRTDVFLSVSAEQYYSLEFMMYIENNSPDRAIPGPTKGKVQWRRTIDNDFDAVDREAEFDIQGHNSWYFYKVNLGPYQYWQGDIFDLRFFPFIDGREGDRFFIKFIRISSVDEWTCSNTQCSYYQFYTHPCPGAGAPSYCEANTPKQLYTTASGVNSEFVISIDDYGNEVFDLATNLNVEGSAIAKVIGSRISTLGMGGYAFVTVDYTDADTIRIHSGTTGTTGSVEIPYSPAAEELGFYDSEQSPTYTVVEGIDPATGYDYASTRLLQTYELNAIVDGDLKIAYVHNPNQFSVEGGRRDFNEIGNPRLLSDVTDDLGEYRFRSLGKTVIDLSHKIDNSGKLKHFWVYGVPEAGAQIKVLRQHNDGGFTVVHSLDIPLEDAGLLYTRTPVVCRTDEEVLVSKGDVIGFYNVDAYIGTTATSLPDATFCIYSGNVEGRLEKTKVYSYGVGGIAMYARGNIGQSNTMLDIDLGERLNVSEFVIFGKEYATSFEFNIASCLDLEWDVDLFGESHWHRGYTIGQTYGWSETHQNAYYGKECLDDGIRTADNGQVGDSIFRDGTGLGSTGHHSYFYVNGDAEWLWSASCGKSEYCYPQIVESSGGFERDPIAFTLYFPNAVEYKVHKCIIYFKEARNFRHLEVSTMVHPYHITGNADDPRFELVPYYDSVYLNGVHYPRGANPNVDLYVYNNPMTDDLYNFSSSLNNQQLFASVQVNWSILGHEFPSRNCRAFRFYTAKHSSTKITEMEVYSSISNDASLVDNATLYYSDYGDIWRVGGFEIVEDKAAVKCFVGGTPRYFRLALESHSEFYINEMDLNLTEQVYYEEGAVLLDEAKNNTVNPGTPVPITNIYDKPFDLTVSIPRELGVSSDLVLWNKLGSEYERTHPKIGPTPTLFKSDDFPITMYYGQCAINTPCYGLKDLIEGKIAYYSINGLDWHIYNWSLLTATDLNIVNTDILYSYAYTFDFTDVNSKFWKFEFAGLSHIYKVSDIALFRDSTRVDYIEDAYYDVATGSTAMDVNKSFTSDGVDMAGENFIYDTFDDGNYSFWQITGDVTPTEENGYLRLYKNNSTTSCRFTSQVMNTMAPETNFEYVLDFSFETFVGQNSVEFSIIFYSGVSSEKLKLVFTNPNVSTCTANVWTVTGYYAGVSLGSFEIPLSVLCKNIRYRLRILKADSYATLYINNLLIDSFIVDPNDVMNKFSIDFPASGLNNFYIYELFTRTAVLVGPGVAFGVGFDRTARVNNGRLVLFGDITLDLTISSSDTNSTFYLLPGEAANETQEDVYYRLAIGLDKRHHLDIIRNYGTYDDLARISALENTEFSSAELSLEMLNQNIFNSDITDCRTLIIKTLASDGIERRFSKIGVYPSLVTTNCIGGGYNLDWIDLGKELTSYPRVTNIAYGADITGSTNYWRESFPEKAVDGSSGVHTQEASWGFKDNAPVELYMDFGQEVEIDKIIIHGGYSPDVPDTVNTGYTFSIDNTVSGTNYVQVFTVAGLSTEFNDPYERYFAPIAARRAKLVVDSFVGIDYYEEIPDTNPVEYENVTIGFIREVEIFTRRSSTVINNEDWPVVCTNLLDQYAVTTHKLENNVYLTETTWDNNESWFYYSDSIINDPQKAQFAQSGGYITEYESTISTGNVVTFWSVEYDTNIYIHEGTYTLEWESYYAEEEKHVSIIIRGTGVEEEVFAENLGVDWVQQSSNIHIPEDGVYTIVANQNYNNEDNWGVRNVKIYRSTGYSKWVAVKNDTATNYSYDDNPARYGKRYLSNLKVYGDDKYDVTERHWWWESSLSTLSTDYFNVKATNGSLAVDYPTASGVETLALYKADTFGQDRDWDMYDLISVWLHVSDINKMDASFGDITIGAVNNTSTDFYYRWSLADANLQTGWNLVEFSFEDAHTIYPSDTDDFSGYLASELDLANNNRELDEVSIRFRGNNTGSLRLLIDGLTIKRNTYNTDCRFGKGLCLTGFDHLYIPLSNVSLDRGSLEFWIKPGTDSRGIDVFGTLKSATIFTLNNNNNDIVCLRLDAANWLETVVGNIRKQTLFSVPGTPTGSFFERNDLLHIGFVWSNDGRDIGDSNDTFRLYINNQIIMSSDTPWDVADTKSAFFKLGGGITQSEEVYDTYSSAVYDNIKVYNYCKTDFNINDEDVTKDIKYLVENYIELSSDNINFYSVGDESLPLVFEQVPPGESVTVYVRANKAENFSLAEATTAQIIVEWLTSV